VPRYSIELTPQPNAEQERTPPRVSVVVVSLNRVEALRRCLASLEKSEGRGAMQVIVVDNGSTDGAAQLDSEFPADQFVRLPKNFGLTKAMNIGWRAADSEFVLFLHDDTEVAPEAVMRLVETLESTPDAGAVAPLLMDEEGRPAPQLGSLPPNGEWRPATVDGNEPKAVEYPRGAAIMMRVFLLKSIRQIDEHYGQFGADADLATQIRRGGKKILLVPSARVLHQGSPGYNAMERADFQLARAVYLGKYQGFVAGLQARIGAVLGSLFGFRLGEFKYAIAGQKIDGTQQ
jgi:GT2 family glycosyltransferase